MEVLRRLARLETYAHAARERTLASTAQLATAMADLEARRKSGVEIRHEEEQRYARVYELIDIARARRDKALGIRRKPRVG